MRMDRRRPKKKRPHVARAPLVEDRQARLSQIERISLIKWPTSSGGDLYVGLFLDGLKLLFAHGATGPVGLFV